VLTLNADFYTEFWRRGGCHAAFVPLLVRNFTTDTERTE
jgi:hypothetical protein